METKKRIAILKNKIEGRDGPSARESKVVSENLDQKKYDVLEISLDQNRDVYIEAQKSNWEKIKNRVDLVIFASREPSLEGGKIQKDLEESDIPFLGSGSLPSATAFSKKWTKQILEDSNLRSPVFIKIEREGDLGRQASSIYRNFTQPCIIKPEKGSSSLGVSVCENISEIERALEKVFSFGKEALVEEFIEGREFSMILVEDYRGEKVYAFPAFEMLHPGEKFLSFENKNRGGEELGTLPRDLREEDKEKMAQVARESHSLLNLQDFSKIDFIVHPKRGVYILELNPFPSLSEHSLAQKSFDSVGLSLEHFLEKLLEEKLSSKIKQNELF